MNHLGKCNQTIVRYLYTGNTEYTDHINQAQGRDTGGTCNVPMLLMEMQKSLTLEGMKAYIHMKNYIFFHI